MELTFSDFKNKYNPLEVSYDSFPDNYYLDYPDEIINAINTLHLWSNVGGFLVPGKINGKPLVFTTKQWNTNEGYSLRVVISEEETDTYYLPYAVDIPQIDKEEFLNVGYFATKEEAVEFCKEKYGAENGTINLISKI